ncbi:DUF3575 domain-containing protein [Pontibacter qinzhouensis]|uniref:DUF3575 domain-containing protein n=1 Tax=Pontibacter qinzhouensis TaxID=2603253 RepID=A0A5C8IJX6_9BACT|nr:DUF3575 domain-containing protein [Pontibacter qinzhouensis]TXK21364.1 DUF3575 domain-containing protein [Pontibacter qinzhouensis]
MKKVFLILFAIAAIASGTAQAQTNVFKVNVFSPIVRTGSVFYERSISEDKSAQLGLFYTGFSIEGTSFKGFGVTPEFRKYLSKSKEAPEGFYLAPFLRYQSFKLTADKVEMEGTEGKATYNTFGGGLLIGNQWVLGDRFVIDAFFGPSYNKGNIKVTSGTEDDFDTGAFGGFGIRTGLAFGIKF